MRRQLAAAARRCYESAAAASVPVIVKPAVTTPLSTDSAAVISPPSPPPSYIRPPSPPPSYLRSPSPPPSYLRPPSSPWHPEPPHIPDKCGFKSFGSLSFSSVDGCSCIRSFSTGRPPEVPYNPFTYQPPEFPYDPSTYKPYEPSVAYGDFQARGIIPGEHFIFAISLKKAIIANAHFVQRSRRSHHGRGKWPKKEHPSLRCRPHGLWLDRDEIHKVLGSYDSSLTGEYIDRLYGIIPHSLLVHEYENHASGFKKDKSSPPYYTQVEYSCLICDMFHAVVRDIEAALDETYATVKENTPLYGLHWKKLKAIVFQDALGKRLGQRVGLSCRDNANGEFFGAELHLKYDHALRLVHNDWIKVPNHWYSGIKRQSDIYL